jgi:hypothetical protein
METIKQVSVFLENKPGRLANVLSALARDKVNVIALTVMDSHEHSVLRLVTEDLARTIDVIKGLGMRVVESDVLLVELRHQPGALAHVCETLAGEHINIDYCYVSSGGRNGKVFGIFKVASTEKAMRALGESPNTRRMERRQLRERRSYQTPRATATRSNNSQR